MLVCVWIRHLSTCFADKHREIHVVNLTHLLRLWNFAL